MSDSDDNFDFLTDLNLHEAFEQEEQLEDKTEVFPLDHPERKRFQTLNSWFEDGGVDLGKVKLELYDDN